jgi:DNA-binding NarL/FixJ family response regulator
VHSTIAVRPSAASHQDPALRTLRVLVVDDQSVFREGLGHVLRNCPDLEVTTQPWPSGSVLEAVSRGRPDVVVLDPAGCRGAHGGALDGIAGAFPGVGVLVLTATADDGYVFLALRAGARGYLLKDADASEVMAAIRTVGAGGAVFGPTVAARLRDYLAGTVAPSNFPELTDREHAVLDLLASGCSNLEIAQRLLLSPKTVRNRVSVIFAKIQVADRAQAIVRAREAGLGRRDLGRREPGRRDLGPRRGAAASRGLPSTVGTAAS